MHNTNQGLDLFKTYMVLGPGYQHGRQSKLVFPKSITHQIVQYAQYEDWMKTATDLASLLKRRELNFITQSQAWAQDESLNNAKKWLAKPDKPLITDSHHFFEQTIMPLIKFITKPQLVDEFGRTALMWASFYIHTEALKALLAVPGIDVNAADEAGWTVLMHAVINDHEDAFEALLAMPGINVNAVDNKGWTALMWAVCHGNTEALKVLLAVPGIDLNAVNENGLTVLMMAEYDTEAESLINKHLKQQAAGNKNKQTFN